MFTPATPRKPQYHTDDAVDRTDHVWFAKDSGGWKCCLCGGVTKFKPPPYPTPASYLPDDFERLDESERDLCRY
jgi:hypothetical protein